MTLRQSVLGLLPPFVVHIPRRLLRRNLRWSGKFGSWEAALQHARGYSDPEIISRTLSAARAVREGLAAFERDSVLFTEPIQPFELLAPLMRAAALNDGFLDVIDFGGSFGSTYFQCRPFLQGLRRIRWAIVEQENYVTIGNREFTTSELSFWPSMGLLPQPTRHSIIIAGSSIQYIPDPYEVLSDFANTSAGHMVLDRTPIADAPLDRLCVQYNPKSIYASSYPCWIFSNEKLRLHLAAHWNFLSEYTCPEGGARTTDRARFAFRGLILERKT